MHVISKVKLREFWVQHADSEDALNDWYNFASRAEWSNLLDVQRRYPKAEAVGNFTVFNIKGNNYRLTYSPEVPPHKSLRFWGRDG